jgi:hypothetical protein
MDGPAFDHLTRIVGAGHSRRAASALLGAVAVWPLFGVEPGEAKKKKKKKKVVTLCVNGETIKTKNPKKYPGATVGACCVPTTCAAQGKTCGPLADSCGSTLTCFECPPACEVCANRPDGTKVCGGFAAFSPNPCTTDADCPGEYPVCLSTTTARGTNTTTVLPPIFDLDSPGMCCSVSPC